MFFSTRAGVALTLLGLAAGIHPASAQTTQDYSTQVVNPFYTNVDQFSVTTNASSPTFDRPALARPGTSTTFTNLSGLGKAVAYGTHGFTAADDAAYRITTTTTGYDPQNFLQMIYVPTFDPTKPLVNATLANIPTGTDLQYSVNIGAGTALTLVNTGYYNAVDTAAGHVSVGTSNTTIEELNNGSTTFIPDANTQGTVGQAAQTLKVSSTGTISGFNSFSFAGLQHDAVGDLTATLAHNGVSVTLFDRPDKPATSDNFGSLAAFNSTRKYTFADQGADLAKVAKATVDSYAADPSVDYFPLFGGTYQSLSSLSAFDGMNVFGDWTLTTTDNEVGSTGSFLGFSFNATTDAVPEASTSVSLAIGGVILGLVLFTLRRRDASPSV